MNTLLVKTKTFALKIVRMSRFLQDEKKEYVLSKQMLRSGTCIGAAVRDAAHARNREEFEDRITLALRDSVETEYWLELLLEVKCLNQVEYRAICKENQELTRMLKELLQTHGAPVE